MQRRRGKRGKTAPWPPVAAEAPGWAGNSAVPTSAEGPSVDLATDVQIPRIKMMKALEHGNIVIC